jgi:hypothetical protein
MSGMTTGLQSKAVRERAVLVLRGTGLNIWHYQGFLKNFSLQELAEFRAIYGISGGAVALWFYVLGHLGLFDETVVVDFDRLMRSVMNHYNLVTRLWKMATKTHAYQAEDNLRLLLLLTSPKAAHQTLRDFPLPNFSVVAHEQISDSLLLIDAEAYPHFSIPKVLSYVVTTSATTKGIPLVAREPYQGLSISDFDFANTKTKQQFRHFLSTKHSSDRVFQINILRSGSEANTTYVKVSTDRSPRIRQAFDFILFFLGIPNRRYLETYLRSKGSGCGTIVRSCGS